MIFQSPRAIRISAAILLVSFATLSAHAQDWAKARLDASPRHHEYVTLNHGSRKPQAFVVYPEVKGKVPVVILIHEIFGLTDWAKEMADELAAQGFIVVAPDLLSGFGPTGADQASSPARTPALRPSRVLIPMESLPISTRPRIMGSRFQPETGRSLLSVSAGVVVNLLPLPPTAKTFRQHLSSTGLVPRM